MLGDLNDKLAEVSRLDILEAVDDKAMEYSSRCRSPTSPTRRWNNARRHWRKSAASVSTRATCRRRWRPTRPRRRFPGRWRRRNRTTSNGNWPTPTPSRSSAPTTVRGRPGRGAGEFRSLGKSPAAGQGPGPRQYAAALPAVDDHQQLRPCPGRPRPARCRIGAVPQHARCQRKPGCARTRRSQLADAAGPGAQQPGQDGAAAGRTWPRRWPATAPMSRSRPCWPSAIR